MHVFLQWQKAGALILASLFACVLLVLPVAVRADVTSCRTCMSQCHTADPSQTATVCYAACNHPSVGQPCQGISQGDAAVGFGSARSGAGHRSSRVQGTTTNPAGAPTQPAAPAGNCVDAAVTARRLSAEDAAAIVSRSGRPSTDFSCQRTCTEAQANNCVRGGCPRDDAAVLCCPPGGGIATGDRCGARGAAGTDAAGGQTGNPAGSAGSAATPAATSSEEGSSGSSGGSAAGRLSLPSCIESGNCQVSDLIETGLGAIRFMFGLAGALLLVVFVYAGIEYLFADTLGSVKAAKERLQKAVTGIAIMFFGYTLVRFLVNLLVR